MKKLLSFIMMTAIIGSLFNFQVFSKSNNDYQYENNADGGIVITKYIGSNKDVNIPETIDEKPVTKIGAKAFMKSNISSVTIPNSVKTIDTFAFWNCNGLKSLTIPDGVESIIGEAFNYCYRLDSVSLPKTIKYIDKNAFAHTPWYNRFFSEYTSVGSYSNGCFTVTKADKTGLIDIDKNVVLPCEYDDITPLVSGGFELKKNTQISFVNDELKEVVIDNGNNDKYTKLFSVTTMKELRTDIQAKGTETKVPSDWNELYGQAGRKADLIDRDGNLNIIYDTVKDDKLYIARFNKDLTLKDTLIINKVLPLFGTAIIDEEGNYYILYGKNVEETQKDVANVVISKYDNKGNFINSAKYISGEMSSDGTKEPFGFANASMAISNGTVAAHFGRVMFKTEDGLNHQSSTVIYANIKSMEPVSLPILYCSHSFDQQVIASKNGFAFIDRGDAFPRAFRIDVLNDGNLSGFDSFHFTEKETYQDTCASLGGIVENSLGYVLSGSSVNELSYTPVKDSVFKNKNVFVQVIKKNFMYHSNDSDRLLSKGVTREPNGNPGKVGLNTSGQSYFLPENVADYGVIWLTNYKDNETALNPKIVAVDNGCSVILWEKFKGDSFQGTYFAIVDYAGNIIRGPEKLDDEIRLCSDERPLYYDGKIIWSVAKNDPINKIKIYTLSFEQTKPKLKEEVVDLIGSAKTILKAKASPMRTKIVIVSGNTKNLALLNGYKIGVDDYFLLSDIAHIFNKKTVQFNFNIDKFNKAIIIKPEERYESSSYSSNYSNSKETNSSISNYRIFFGKKTVKANSYLINNNVYFKLKDIASLFNIKLTIDTAKKTTILTLQ